MQLHIYIYFFVCKGLPLFVCLFECVKDSPCRNKMKQIPIYSGLFQFYLSLISVHTAITITNNVQIRHENQLE